MKPDVNEEVRRFYQLIGEVCPRAMPTMTHSCGWIYAKQHGVDVKQFMEKLEITGYGRCGLNPERYAPV